MVREPHSDEQINTALAELVKQPDRGAAIIAAAMIEEILETVILNRLRPLSGTKYKRLFSGTAPLSTFAAKIDIAFAIGLINDLGYTQLNLIKDVRNRFAHEIAPLDFDHPEIKQIISANELLANSGFMGVGSVREAFLWVFRFTAATLIFWRDSRVSLRMVADDCPELSQVIQQYFRDYFASQEAHEPAPLSGPATSQPSNPEKSGQSGE